MRLLRLLWLLQQQQHLRRRRRLTLHHHRRRLLRHRFHLLLAARQQRRPVAEGTKRTSTCSDTTLCFTQFSSREGSQVVNKVHKGCTEAVVSCCSSMFTCRPQTHIPVGTCRRKQIAICWRKRDCINCCAVPDQQPKQCKPVCHVVDADGSNLVARRQQIARGIVTNAPDRPACTPSPEERV